MSKKIQDQWVRIINVSDTVLHKKGYTLYKVTSKIFPKNSVEAVTEVIVWKRYNDFKKLHKALHTIHQNLHLKGSFPPFAKTRFFGRFDESVIEERRQSALNLLQFANNFPPLFTSQVFVKFFEDGHSVDQCLLPCDGNNQSVDCILPGNLSNVTEIPELTTTNSVEKSFDSDIKSSRNSLGGIWQHQQIADTISLSSHCTEDDEDDHTTFTDDESSVYRPSIDLSEFDPLLETDVNSSLNKPTTVANKISDNWLLSALQSCSNQIAEKDSEGVLEVPSPFDDLEYGEIATPSNDYPFSDSNNDTYFTFDLISSTQKNPSENFNKIPNKGPVEQCSEENVCNCDDFATTPTAIKDENKYQHSFILHASKYIVKAQEAECLSHYEEAFENYKKAIDILLQGIQRNDLPDIRDAVRKKILLYLMRAEEIYENNLPKKKNMIFKEKIECNIDPVNKISSLQGCIQDLNKYKVLGILENVLLVLDISNNNTYVVKTLYKSSIPKAFSAPHIVPQNIPFMVKLHQIYETSYAIFLILEHASGGKLWDYVSSYLQHSPLSPGNEGTYLYIQPKSKADHSNVYSGKRVSVKNKTDSSSNLHSQDYDLTPSEICPSSYVALFRQYAATVNKNNVALAKYSKIPHVPYSDCINVVDETELSLSQNEDYVSTFHCNQVKCLKLKTMQDETTQSTMNQHKNSRNRLSSSTGSLETAISQKTCLLDAFSALDDAIINSSTRPTHLPESCVHVWAAEIIVALEALHNLGITWMDFHPDNILLGAEGHILLTYQSKWNNIDFFVKESAKEDLFCAPEVGNIFPVTVDSDWWSLGAILYELLVGRSLVSCHPTGITRHTVLNFPSDISMDAKDFITKLLQYNPSERLGSGIYGVEELKSHPFFRTVDWNSLYQTDCV